MTGGRAFPARYRGRCAAHCGDPIGPGDLVVYVEDELVHDDCAADGPALAAPARPDPPPCPSCWLVHAGECP